MEHIRFKNGYIPTRRLDEITTESKLGGKKYDQGKIRYDLIPPVAYEGIAKVFTMGAKKYGDRNWEGGVDYLRLYAATMRHLQAWRQGIDIDEESGLSHLYHAMCNLMMLSSFMDNPNKYSSFDNR